MTTEEEWRQIPCSDGYEVSSLGRVRSIDRVVVSGDGRRSMRFTGRVLKPWLTHGYEIVMLSGQVKAAVHVLVLEAFVGPRPAGLIALHGPAGKADNSAANLRWGTTSENARDRSRDGTDPNASRADCIRGHALAAPNLTPAVARRGYRGCLACSRALDTKYRARRRGQAIDMQVESDRQYARIHASSEVDA